MGAIFSHERYNQIIEQSVSEIKKLGTLKGGEYAGDQDRLANFRRNGQNLGLNMETIWAVYAGKHWDAVMQFIQDLEKGTTRTRLEPIEGRVDDLLVYLILFKCMLAERSTTPTKGETPPRTMGDVVRELEAMCERGEVIGIPCPGDPRAQRTFQVPIPTNAERDNAHYNGGSTKFERNDEAAFGEFFDRQTAHEGKVSHCRPVDRA